MDRLTRIAFLSEHASPVALLGGVDAGGQNVYVDEVSRNLARHGYAIDVFTRCNSTEDTEVVDWAPGVRVINLTAGPPSLLPKDELWPYMPEFRDSFLNFMVRDEARYALIHGNFWMSGWVATELRRRLGIPAVQIFHAMGKTKRRHQKQVDTSPQDRIDVEMGVVRNVDRMIAQCPAEQAELINDYGADPRKVSIIPSAVNTTIFQPVASAEARKQVGLNPNAKVIVYVGRLVPRKGIRNIVQALALLVRQYEDRGGVSPIAPVAPSSLVLMIVGGETVEPDPVSTPEIGELRRLVAELGVADYVRFTGKHEPNALRYYYSAADAVVSTPWYEPFGLTVLEAQACGRPIIGSAVGGLTYTIQDGKTGFLVPPRNPEALAERLGFLLSSPELCRQMGRAARKRVEREFTWDIVAMRTGALYETVLADREREAGSVETLIGALPFLPENNTGGIDLGAS